MNTAELIALAERVEAATGPDREINWIRPLDADIFQAIGGPLWEYACKSAQLPSGCPPDAMLASARKRAPRYTSSLDAVTALIAEKLPGASWQCGFVHPDQADSDNEPGAWARVFPPWSWLSEDDDGEGIIVSAETPTLALLSAALRALAQAPSTGGQENG